MHARFRNSGLYGVYKRTQFSQKIWAMADDKYYIYEYSSFLGLCTYLEVFQSRVPIHHATQHGCA